jgi:hypothetical protein
MRSDEPKPGTAELHFPTLWLVHEIRLDRGRRHLATNEVHTLAMHFFTLQESTGMLLFPHCLSNVQESLTNSMVSHAYD